MATTFVPDFQPLTKEFLLGNTEQSTKGYDYNFSDVVGFDDSMSQGSSGGVSVPSLLQQNMPSLDSSSFSSNLFSRTTPGYSAKADRKPDSSVSSSASSAGSEGSEEAGPVRKKASRKTTASGASASSKASKTGRAGAASKPFNKKAEIAKMKAESAERLHRKRKRPTSKREPLLDEFSDEEEYNQAWSKWREDRDHNNRSVKRSRQRAKQKKLEVAKSTSSGSRGKARPESTENQLNVARDDLRLLAKALKKNFLNDTQQKRVKTLLSMYDSDDSGKMGSESSKSSKSSGSSRSRR